MVSTIDAIISTFEVPLKAEHLWSPWGHALQACVMMDFTTMLPSFLPVIAVRGGFERIVHLCVLYQLKPLSCEICSCFGHISANCYLNRSNAVPLVINSAMGNIGTPQFDVHRNSPPASSSGRRCSHPRGTQVSRKIQVSPVT